jgi:Holliday junction DNA helicase RuvA
MISHLRGTVLIANNAYLVLEVGGVGYKVFTTPTLLQTPINSELALFIYQKVSDNEISLFGLPDQESLEFFEKLISVSGVGPKIALGIISTGNLQTLRQAISNADSAFFGQVGGRCASGCS